MTYFVDSPLEIWALWGIWIAVALIGGLVSYYAIQAWRSSRERSFGLLAVGLVALSLGSALTWFGLYFMGQDPLICEAGATTFSAAGFGTILVGLRTRVA